MAVSRYFILFILFSFIGWLFECTYCTIRGHHWENRGFLYGPLCPIYGTGVVLGMIGFNRLLASSALEGAQKPIWQIFLICAVGSAILEFMTSWILEKCFHALWWDYSQVPLNLQGRISLPTTCCFGIAGVVFVKWIFPLMERIPSYENPMLYEGLSIILALFLGMDLALTVESLIRLSQRMEEAEERFNARMEAGVQTIRRGPHSVGEAVKAQAKDAGETAAIAAMLAADAAKEHMSGRDRYHLRSIKIYRPKLKKPGSADMPEKLRRFFEELQKHAGKRQD